jgi:hypothetical protein
MYHFYVNDKTGPIGAFLRDTFPVRKYVETLDEHVFATCCVSAFMLIIGILQLPYFLGPTFTPFDPTTITIFQWKDAAIDTPIKDVSNDNTIKTTTTTKATDSKSAKGKASSTLPSKMNKSSELTAESSPTKKNKNKSKKKEN